MNKKGMIACMASAILFGIAPLLTRTIYSYGVDVYSLGFYRSLFALPFLYLLTRKEKVSVLPEKQDLRKIIFVGFFGSALTTLFLNLAYRYIDIGIACTLHFMHPVVVALICVFLFQEKLSRFKIVALALALVGIWMLMDLQGGVSLPGVLFALASSVTYGFYFVSVDKWNLKRLNSFAFSFLLACVVCVSFFTLGIITHSLMIPTSIKLIGLLLAYSIICQVLAISLLQRGIRDIGPQSASFLSLLEPLTSLITGCLFLNETVTGMKVIGCLLIFVAVLVYLTKKKPVA